MAIQTKFVKKGGWRTLESFWNASGTGFFFNPPQASIRVRYGGNSWWNGFTRQQQKLTGTKAFKLGVGAGSLAYARMQISVNQDQNVTYHIFPGGVAVSTPNIPF